MKGFVLFFHRRKINAVLDKFAKTPLGLNVGLLSRPICFNLTGDVSVQLAYV